MTRAVAGNSLIKKDRVFCCLCSTRFRTFYTKYVLILPKDTAIFLFKAEIDYVPI